MLLCVVFVVVVVVVVDDDGNGPDPGPGGSVTFNGAFWEADYPMSFELTSLNEYQDEGGGRGGELPSCYRRGFLFALFYWGGGSSRMSFLIVIMHQTFLYIFSPSIFIVIHVSTPFDSIPLKSVCRDPSDGSHLKQSLHSIGSIVVLIVTLIWGRSRRWTSNPFDTALSSSDQVLWHCLILWLFFVLKVSPTLGLVTLFKFMNDLMAQFRSQHLDCTH